MIPKKSISILALFTLILFQNLFVHHIVYGSETEPKPEPRTVDQWLDDKNIQEPIDSNQVEQNQDLNLAAQPENPIITIMKLIFYTALVCVMIYGLIKFLAVRQKKIQHHQMFQLLGGTTLAPNKSLQLVKVGGKLYLIGVGDQVSLIKEITDEQEMNEIESHLNQQESVISKNLIDQLFQWIRKSEARESQEKQTSFQELFAQSVRKQKMKRDMVEKHLQAPTSTEEEGRSV